MSTVLAALSAGARRDSRRYYLGQLAHARDRLERESDVLRDLVDDAQTERFYSLPDSTGALRDAIVSLDEARRLVEAAHANLPAA